MQMMSQATFQLPDNLFDQVDRIKQVLRNRACGSQADADDQEYKALRNALMGSSISANLPRFVRTCRSLSEFWDFIKSPDSDHDELPTYASRRSFLVREFESLLSQLESNRLQSLDAIEIGKEMAWTSERVSNMWDKAKQRCENDPEGAITAGKSLLESVMKHILHEADMEPCSTDLLKLYKQVSKHLNLSPSQHTEQMFKQILSGCLSVVNGLAAVRNEFSDSHGGGPKSVRPATRHAKFVVSISAVLSNFLLDTWLNVQASSSQEVNSV